MPRLNRPSGHATIGSFLALGLLTATLMTFASPTAGQAIDQPSNPPACDQTIATSFKPDKDTRVVQVAHFKKGDVIGFGPDRPDDAPVAANDVCMVKLIVGPGNP